MFKFFIRKKISSGNQTETENNERIKPLRPSKTRNRRLYERYNVSQQHLTDLNEQDIYVVRDISAKGFSSEVSERAYIRLTIGDIYDARIHYMKENYDLKIKVSWKKNKTIGFEITDTKSSTLDFLKRLLKPVKIANSLKIFEQNFSEEENREKIWLKGDLHTNLLIWKDHTSIYSWQILYKDFYIEWTQSGVTTGKIEKNENEEPIDGYTHIEDQTIDETKRQFAFDIIMALESDLQLLLAPTIER